MKFICWKLQSVSGASSRGKPVPNWTPPANFASRPNSPTDSVTPVTTATSAVAPDAEAKSPSDPQRYLINPPSSSCCPFSLYLAKTINFICLS